MSNMCIKCEFLAGTSLEDAILEAKSKASIFNVSYIFFDFNGGSFSIGRNADKDKIIEEWNDENPNKNRHFVYS